MKVGLSVFFTACLNLMVVLHFLSASRGQEKYILAVLKNRAGSFHLSYIFFPVSSDRRLSPLLASSLSKPSTQKFSASLSPPLLLMGCNSSLLLCLNSRKLHNLEETQKVDICVPYYYCTEPRPKSELHSESSAPSSLHLVLIPRQTRQFHFFKKNLMDSAL